MSNIDDWDEIERLLLRAIAWLEAGGRFSSLSWVGYTQPEIVKKSLEGLRRLKAEGKTQDDWQIYFGSEFLTPKPIRKDKVYENTLFPPLPPKTYPPYCQLPMKP
ncbi:MAG: hypothetical protein HYV63_10265 [Candidatus Schekmanbacteria bacterium]|nr:hypothetical protein [Candidatus Schekmanbacteria bacterium]